MPPRIEWVQWGYTPPLPRGLKFDEETGTFSGTPTVPGEYTVPVFVETEYGSDIKDVEIKVETATYGYGVYSARRFYTGTAVGKELFIKNSAPDADGFYPLSEAHKSVISLSSYPSGYRTNTQSSDIYGIGITGVIEPSTYLSYHTDGRASYQYTKRDNIKAVLFTLEIPRYYSELYVTNEYLHAFASLALDGTLTINQVLYYGTKNSTDVEIRSNHYQEVTGPTIKNLRVLDFSADAYGIRWLSEDGTQDCFLKYTVNAKEHEASSELLTTDLGYKAIKLIAPAPFNFLSEDRLLNNNPDNFPYGEIKDAWGHGQLMYIQTTNNQLYEYITSNEEWDLLGTYDIKKLEVPTGENMLFLTTDGDLFHKGVGIDITAYTDSDTIGKQNIVPQSETLTHIYPSQKFIDFALGYGAFYHNYKGASFNPPTCLIVLKE